MGHENLCRGEGAVVANERVHAVGFFVVVDGGLVDAPLDVIATFGHATVFSVRSGASALGLLENVLWPRHPLDLEVTANTMLLEDQFDLQIDAGGAAHP